MRVLVIGPAERERIMELRAFAAATPQDAVAAMAASERDLNAYRDAMAMYSMALPSGFAVFYTQEIQPNAPPPGLCHHISIAVDQPDKLPSVSAVEIIMAEFGMRPITTPSRIWIEDIRPGEKVVNVLQLVDANGTNDGR